MRAYAASEEDLRKWKEFGGSWEDVQTKGSKGSKDKLFIAPSGRLLCSVCLPETGFFPRVVCNHKRAGKDSEARRSQAGSRGEARHHAYCGDTLACTAVHSGLPLLFGVQKSFCSPNRCVCCGGDTGDKLKTWKEAMKVMQESVATMKDAANNTAVDAKQPDKKKDAGLLVWQFALHFACLSFACRKPTPGAAEPKHPA